MSTFAPFFVPHLVFAPPLPGAVQRSSAEFSGLVIAWQQRHGRHDLPWQQTRDPYRIWLSEIMLQQTQVQTVLTYYPRFLQQFPDLDSLADAPLEAVMLQWSGLGYYARGRNLHACARRVKADLGGVFPQEPAAIAALPGIGRSTAHAIAAFAWGAPVAILDGNVKRVLARCFGVEGPVNRAAVERHLWRLAEALLPVSAVAEGVGADAQRQAMAAYTQGMMDLGAGVCRLHQPRCEECPLAAACVARHQGRQAVLPTPRETRVVPQRTVPLAVLLRAQPGAPPAVYLEQRPANGIWGGLYSLPETTPAALAARLGISVGPVLDMPVRQHVLTHFRLQLEPRVAWAADAAGGLVACAPKLLATSRWWPLEKLAQAPLPAPVRQILQALPQGIE